ncbi:putative O-methylsterigmatocystin oxidoreductase [Seiridium cardinale]|uniref:O-methylsterigmatocystin oxidoreductase n=1 Tax=Seiridium cardinale TaxID=138064 RepID=A0ABR2YAD4_9PEZI
MTDPKTILLTLAAILLLAVFLARQSDGLKTIPGPKGLPLIGNTHQLGRYPHRKYLEWSAQYGELFKVQMGLQNWVFLNTPEAVRDILDRQSAATSGRPGMPVVSDLISGGQRFLLMTYTPRWRKLRAMVHKLLTPKASEVFKPSQEFETKQLLFDILTKNEDQESFYQHVRRYTTSIVMTSTYGRRVPVWDCEDVREIYGLMKEFSESASPGAYIAELIPWLANLPVYMQWWRGSALKLYTRQRDIWMKYWNTLQSQADAGRAPDCFGKQFRESDFQKQGISDEQAAFVAGTMIEAGSETTSSALNSAIKYLIRFPDAQVLARKELASQIGDNRVPSFGDEDALPYIRAMVKEVLRIRPVTTIGSPHYTTADITYKNYVIPKDTVVTLCQYTIHYDAKRWESPEDFIPSRYLGHPLKAGAYAASGDAEGRDHFDFGAGRRICPGMHLAENSLFITLASILWLFEIKAPLDADGNEEFVDISDAAYEDGANTLPKQYRARFVPVNEQRAQTLLQTWDQARVAGFTLGNVHVNEDGVIL